MACNLGRCAGLLLLAAAVVLYAKQHLQAQASSAKSKSISKSAARHNSAAKCGSPESKLLLEEAAEATVRIGSGFTADVYENHRRPEVLFKIYRYYVVPSQAAMAYINGGGGHPAINKPILSCSQDGSFVQVQRRARGVDLHSFISQKRSRGTTLRLSEQSQILSQLASAFAHLDHLGFRLVDIHPLNVIIEPSTLQLEIIDIDTLATANVSRCVCLKSELCGGRVGCIFHSAPEALAHCNQARCDARTMLYSLGQFAAFLAIPEARADALSVSTSPATGNTLTVLRNAAMPPTATSSADAGSGWMAQLCRYLLAEAPESRPPLRQVTRYLDRRHATLHASLQALTPSATAAIPAHEHQLPYAPFGYHVDSSRPSTWTRMLARWSMVARSVRRDADVFHDGDTRRPVYAVDWGSNEGFFSISLLHSFPKWRVLSVDVNALYHGRRSQDAQRQKLEELLTRQSAARGVLCEGSLSARAIFKASAKAGTSEWQPLDYQLALSIFHWLPLPTEAEFRKVLGRFLLSARTTFLELPDPAHAGSYNGNPGYAEWRRWYTPDVSVEERIRAALERTGSLYTIELLGTATIDYGPRHPATTTRGIYRVDVFWIPPPSSGSGGALGGGAVGGAAKHARSLNRGFFDELQSAIPCRSQS